MSDARPEAHPSTEPGLEGGAETGPFDARRLSYATTFSDPVKAGTIRSLEWMTGKWRLLRLIRAFERAGAATGQAFWPKALGYMGIELRTPAEQVARIPRHGPVVVVANHPHGLVDGMVLAELVGRVRTDYRILVRSLLAGVPGIDGFLLPVPFPHEPDARARSVEMRRRAMAQLRAGGVVVLFPAGSVAASRSLFGPVAEPEWNPFTATLIRRSGAVVVPVFFPGANSRWYQIAHQLSPTLRQGLLLHEVVRALNRPQAPVIGAPIGREELSRWGSDSRGLVDWLRRRTLALGQGAQRVGTGVSPR